MPGKSEMTYEELMSVYRQESRQTTLSKVTSDFYTRVAKYLDVLDKRCADNKNGADVSGMLLSQLKTAKEKSAGIYESRMRKILLMAMSAAFGAEPRLDNATSEEQSSFETIKTFFIEHRKNTLSPKCDGEPIIINKTESHEDTPVAKKIILDEPAVVADEDTTSDKSDKVLIRILEDLPVFAGAEKNYQLMKEDVIDLPRRYAEILLKNNKAIEIKHSL